jgi:conjugal transfer/entry exclusion protein
MKENTMTRQEIERLEHKGKMEGLKSQLQVYVNEAMNNLATIRALPPLMIPDRLTMTMRKLRECMAFAQYMVKVELRYRKRCEKNRSENHGNVAH